jgi:hypothetical protein
VAQRQPRLGMEAISVVFGARSADATQFTAARFDTTQLDTTLVVGGSAR